MAIAIAPSDPAQGSSERSTLDRMLPYGLVAPAVFVAMIRPAIVAVGTFAFVLSWGEFILALGTDI
jgi:hypothetical protein